MARGHLSKARDVLQTALATEIAHSYLTEEFARAEGRSGLRASAAARRATYAGRWKGTKPGLEIACHHFK